MQGQQRGHPAGNEATQTLELAAGGGKPVDSGGHHSNRIVPGVPGAGVDAGGAMVKEKPPSTAVT